MTPHEHMVDCIERLYPLLRPRFVHEADDEDLCQVVLCDMLRKADTLQVTTDAAFTDTFSRFYGTRKWIDRGRRARQLSSGTYYMTHPGGIPHKYTQRIMINGRVTRSETDLAIPSTASLTTEYNPWDGHRTNALEWIDQLPTPLARKVMTLYYIEGYTLSEVGVIMHWHRDTVGAYLKEGVAFLKAMRQCDMEEGRNVSVGPTLQGGNDEP